MQKISNPIVFFGTEDFSLISLKALVEAGFPVQAVVTKPDSKKGRGQKLIPSPIKQYAEQNSIPVWQPNKLSDIAENIKSFTKPVGVLVSYGKIIPQTIIDLFIPGIINVHPSLLPAYRGPSPIESAILNGDQETGVSLMKLSAKMDAGPVYAFTPLELTGKETKPQLYKHLGSLGAAMLVNILPDIVNGSLSSPMPQDDSRATYCKLLEKLDSYLDPDSLSAGQAERKIRAHIGFPKTKFDFFGQTIVIQKSHVSKEKAPLSILCRDGAYLVIDELTAPSGRTMSAEAFINGYS